MNYRFLCLMLGLMCATCVPSCRLALHTLPDAVGRQDFASDDVALDIYECREVLYVKMQGRYVSPPIAVMERLDFVSSGEWRYVPRPNLKDSAESASFYYIPMTREQVAAWESLKNRPLTFRKYDSAVLTEAQMRESGGRKIAEGCLYGPLRKEIIAAATQKRFYHYALQPITLPLKVVDTVSVVPITAAAGLAETAALLVAWPFMIYCPQQASETCTSPQGEKSSLFNSY